MYPQLISSVNDITYHSLRKDYEENNLHICLSVTRIFSMRSSSGRLLFKRRGDELRVNVLDKEYNREYDFLLSPRLHRNLIKEMYNRNLN